MDVNERLNKYINDNGIKQSYVAQKTGIPAAIISRTLNGERKLLASEFLEICSALNIDPNEFRNKN